MLPTASFKTYGRTISDVKYLLLLHFHHASIQVKHHCLINFSIFWYNNFFINIYNIEIYKHIEIVVFI